MVFILVGARVFSLTFYGVNGHVWVEHLLTSLPGGQIGFLIFVNILVFLLAFFLDFFELAFIIVPLLGPAADKLGIDLIWFGVILGVNMQTSFMHPPFGFALFYLRSVAPKEPYKDKVTGKTMEPVTTGQIYWGAVPFVVIQCIMVALVIAVPADGHALQERRASTSTRRRRWSSSATSPRPTSTFRARLRAAEDPVARPGRLPPPFAHGGASPPSHSCIVAGRARPEPRPRPADTARRPKRRPEGRPSAFPADDAVAQPLARERIMKLS